MITEVTVRICDPAKTAPLISPYLDRSWAACLAEFRVFNMRPVPVGEESPSHRQRGWECIRSYNNCGTRRGYRRTVDVTPRRRSCTELIHEDLAFTSPRD